MLEVEQQINEISNRVFGSARLDHSTEFHAVDVFHRKRNFQKIANFSERLKILSDFFRIASRDDIGRIDVCIDVSKLYSSKDAEKIAFMYFCERCERYLKPKKSMGLLIGDRESDRVSERSSIALSQYRISGTEFDYGLPINHLFESVHFTHSHLSRFLQLADFYCWELQFGKRNRSSSNKFHRAVLDLTREKGLEMFPSKYKHWPS